MKKEQYAERIQQIEDSIDKLSQEKESLIANYIDSNRQFLDGQKVEITTKEHPYWTTSQQKEPAGIIPESKRFAFVVGYRVNHEGSLEVLLKESKKDGTISKKNDYLYLNLETLKSV
jgi:nitrogenase molybdenum-iron protein alpha/beta subunit